MLDGRKHARVGPNLGDDQFRCAPLNVRDCAQQLNGLLKKGDLLLDRVRQPIDLLARKSLCARIALIHRVQIVEATLKRLLERRQLGAQPALRLSSRGVAGPRSTPGSISGWVSSSRRS